MRRNLRICASSSITRMVAGFWLIGYPSLFFFHLRLRVQREVQGQACAQTIQPFAHCHPAAMGAEHALADRQTQTSALPTAITSGGGVEHIENLRALVLGNTWPLVTDNKAQFFGIRFDGHTQTPLGR